MKKLILAFIALFTITVSASAMSYEQAREQALFLTDKMAYELNLTEDQYEAAYEINLDYLMGINNYSDIYGNYWQQRNIDLQYILYDWQYRNYLECLYFYRPIYWDGDYWHFRIYARYPHRNYYYFGRPHFYTVYRGRHSWRNNSGRSWYKDRTYGYRGNGRYNGMRDNFNNGIYGRGRSFGNLENRSNNTMRESSTRTTVRNGDSFGENRSFGSYSPRTFESTRPNNTFGSRSNSFGNSHPTAPGTFGSRGSGNSTRTSTPNRSSGSFGGHR